MPVKKCLLLWILAHWVALTPSDAQVFYSSNQANERDVIRQLKAGHSDSAAITIKRALLSTREQQDSLAVWIRFARKVLGCKRDQLEQAEAAAAWGKYAIEQCWRKPGSADELEKLAWLCTDIGYAFQSKMGKPFEAYAYYQQAADIFTKELHLEKNLNAADYIYKPLGNIYGRLREYKLAEHYLGLSCEILDAHGRQVEAAQVCNDMGILYCNQRKYDQAIEAVNRGLRYPDIRLNTRILLLHTLSLAQLNVNQKSEALETNNKSRSLLQSHDAASLPPYKRLELEADLFENYGLIYQAMKQLDSSSYYHRKNLEIYLELTPDGVGRDLAQSYHRLGDLMLEQGKPDSADWAAQKMLYCLFPYANASQQPDWLPAAAELYPEHVTVKGLELAAAAQYAMYIQSPQPQKLIYCLNAYELLIQADELLRVMYIDNAAVSQRQALARNNIEQALHICALGRQQAPYAANWAERAFYFMEKGKAWLLVREDEQRRLLSQLDESQLNEERELKTALSRLYDKQTQASKNKDETATAELSRQITSTLQELANLRNKISWQYANSRLLANNILPALQQSLQTEEAAANYFMGDQGVYLVYISNGQIAFYHHTYTQTRAQIALMRDALTNSELQYLEEDYPQFAAAAHQLSKLLLQDILPDIQKENIQKLVIFPDDELSLLPFELLPTEKPANQGGNWSNFPYLIRRLAVSFDYAAGMRLLREKQPASASVPRFVGYAPEYRQADGSGLTSRERSLLIRDGQYDLPYARDEVKAIASLLNGDAILGAAATKDHFQLHANQYDIVHLAMHATVNFENPLFSKLLFAASTTGGDADDLTANALTILPLRASLVVLSACNTGVAQVQKGEGTMSLARSFSQLGVPSVVMSLWQAADKPTSDLMVAFYQKVKAGQSLDDALRQAKLEALESSKNHKGHPFYWAPFVVIGQTSPLEGW